MQVRHIISVNEDVRYESDTSSGLVGMCSVDQHNDSISTSKDVQCKKGISPV